MRASNPFASPVKASLTRENTEMRPAAVDAMFWETAGPRSRVVTWERFISFLRIYRGWRGREAILFCVYEVRFNSRIVLSFSYFQVARGWIDGATKQLPVLRTQACHTDECHTDR